jgi:hypothetical protein
VVLHLLNYDQSVEKIARLFLRLAEDGLQLVRLLQLLDHLRSMGFPMFQNQVAQAVHLVHLLPPFQSAAAAVHPLH